MLLTGIGDVVHGLPVARALRRAEPDARILWVAEPVPAQVLAGNPDVDEVVVFGKSRGLEGLMALREALRARPCDLTLNLQRYFKSVFPTMFSGAPVRVGLPPSHTRDGVRWFNTHAAPAGPWRHTQDLFLDVLDVVGVPRPDPLVWPLPTSPREDEAARSFFGGLPRGRPVAGLVLASANRKKDWPVDRYARLAEVLVEELGFTVLLLGGPAAREAEAAAHVVAEARTRPLDARSGDVRELVWKVKGCDLVVAPDTGPLHIAHALEVPVVGLYGATNPARLGPYVRYRDLVIDAYTDPGEAPDDPSRTDPRAGRMERIEVEDVLSRVRRAMQHYGAGARKSWPGGVGERSGPDALPAGAQPGTAG